MKKKRKAAKPLRPSTHARGAAEVSPEREKRIFSRVKAAAGRPRRKTGEIALLGALRRVGGAWLPEVPAYARRYRGGVAAAEAGAGPRDPAYVPVIAGIILDKEGKRVASRVVRLHPSASGQPILTRTDNDGHFRFPEVRPGEYFLRSGQMLKRIVVVDPRTEVVQ